MEKGYNLVRLPLLKWNHSDSVHTTLTFLASCFLYSLSIIVNQSLSWQIQSNAFLKSTKQIYSEYRLCGNC